jgi:hypothetical protein
MIDLAAIVRLVVWIVVALVAIVVVQYAYGQRAAIGAFLAELVKGFGAGRPLVGVRYIGSEEAERAAEPAQASPERPTDRSAHTNAAEPRSVGSANPAERLDLTVLDGPQLALMQQIARHKLERPTDGKEASAFTLIGARKGSSKAYQAFSQAWDLLYPAPAPAATPLDLAADDPDAWEHGERPGQLIRRQRTAAR